MTQRSSSGVLLAALVVFPWACSSPGRANAQQEDSAKSRDETVNVLISVPRDLRNRLARAEDALREKQFYTAASELFELSTALGTDDYFLVKPDAVTARGCRSEVQQLFNSLTPEARETYERLHGTLASKQLGEAIDSRDVSKLETVAKTWFETDAGYQATLLLGRMYLDRNQPLDGASCFQRLAEAPAGMRRYEPQVSVLLATAWLNAGMPAEARDCLLRLRQRLPDAKIRLGDREVGLFEVEDPLAAIAGRVKVASGAVTKRPAEWLVYQGDLARNAVVLEAGALAERRWNMRLVDNDAAFEFIRDEEQKSLAADLTTMPVLHPLFVRNQVIVRTVDRLLGVNASGPKRLWHYPPKWTGDATSDAEAEKGQEKDTVPPRRVLKQRAWADGIYGQTSSDGTLLFLVDGLDRSPDPSDVFNAQRLALLGRMPNADVRVYNRLAALDLKRDGALAWLVGDVSGESEPLLAGAFFLGPPLPLAGDLYALVEINGVVKLSVLDARTGQQRWSLAVASGADQPSARFGAVRHFAATPSFSHGILVCPTSLGAVVGVDVVRRAFAWGFQQQSNQLTSRYSAVGTDGTATLAENRVFAPSPTGHVHCLNLADGTLLWSRQQPDLAYLACVIDGTCMLVCKHRFFAVNSSDGQPAWSESPFIAIPAGGMASGRGFCDRRFYYLPTTDPELLQIEVKTGRVARRFQLGQNLGNLVRCGPFLISQNAAHLTVFHQDSALPDGTQFAATSSAEPVDLAGMSTDELLQLLGHDRFGKREGASLAILQRGQESINGLAAAAGSSDLEVSYRATSLLLRHLHSPDTEISFLAYRALAGTSSADPRRAYAARAFEREMRLQEPRALRKLVELGADIQPDGKGVALRTGWKGGNEGLAELRWLAKLSSLELKQPHITDKGLRHLRGSSKLESLNLNRASITDRGLAHLQYLPNLKTLLLQGTSVTDAAVEPLSSLRQLRAINLLQTKFSPQGVGELKKRLPKAQILF